MQLISKKTLKIWLKRFHLISLAIGIKHIYWNFRCILTDKEILPRLSELTYLYSQKSADNSFAGESESLKFVTDNMNTINQYCVDIAASNGIEMSSTLQYFRDGWGGIAVEFNPERFSQLAFCYQEFSSVALLREKVVPSNVLDILSASQAPKNFGVLNLDIDSYDLEVLAAIFEGGYRPSVISMEINEKIPPGVYFNVLYSPSHFWRGDHFYGCSLSAASKLIRPFGYILSKLQFNNAIYVHKDSIALSESIFQDLQDKDAYEIGYQFANNRKEMFPWNNEMEYLLDLTPEEAEFQIRQVFGKYSNSFDLWVENS